MTLCLEGFHSWLQDAKVCGVEPGRPFGDINVPFSPPRLLTSLELRPKKNKRPGRKKESTSKDQWNRAVFFSIRLARFVRRYYEGF